MGSNNRRLDGSDAQVNCYFLSPAAHFSAFPLSPALSRRDAGQLRGAGTGCVGLNLSLLAGNSLLSSDDPRTGRTETPGCLHCTVCA